MRLAIYDMDRTVTRRPTWTRFLIHAALRRAPWRLALLPGAAVAGIGYLTGFVSRGGLKQVTQRLMLGPAVPETAVARLAEGFAEQEVAAGLFPGALARIAADRADGCRLVLATASCRFYVDAIARRLGFDAVIATDVFRRGDGAILPRIDGENCYGEAKLRKIEAWLAAQRIDRGAARVRAYSDHVSDAPMLAWADEGFAVNAHAPLRALAAERGWEVLDWR